ncbi:MAG: SDR family NAD(P)-dependent oxidoreductase [Chloroflexi bacterium]|nr:SDR family NAD(P)-dependent oxidoreductase [Chloroflexota bacterium]
MAVNLKSVFLCAHAVTPHMKSRGKGRIINISSLTVWIAPANMAHYAASKAGVIGLTRTLARALGEFNIMVNCAVPGGTGTEALPERPETVTLRCIKRLQYRKPAAIDNLAATRYKRNIPITWRRVGGIAGGPAA